MVEQQTREGEVVSSNPAGRVSREFNAKNAATSMETSGSWPVTASSEKKIKNFCYYFWGFPHFYFAECKSLPSAVVALGKAAFTVRGFDGGSLLSVALGKSFVE